MSRAPIDWRKTEPFLDRLVALQREEQEAILQRHPELLPGICGQIDHLVMQLDLEDHGLGGDEPPRPEDLPADPTAQACGEKLRLVHELAQQNHLLLENHLRFLNRVFSELFPQNRLSPVYNAFGRMPSTHLQAGMLINATS